MKKRIPILIAAGFIFLILLGLGTNLLLYRALEQHVQSDDVVVALGESVRASVRNLRAHYFDVALQISTALLDPEPGESNREESARKASSDQAADSDLERAISNTQDARLRGVLEKLREHDHQVTDPLETRVLQLAASDRDAARRLYLKEYLPAQRSDMELIDEALPLAVEEVRAMDKHNDEDAAWTQSQTAFLIGLFCVIGITGAIILVGFISRSLKKWDEATRQYRDIMEQSLDVICSFDQKGNFVRVSAASEKVLGYRPEELEGHSSFFLVHPNDVKKTRLICARAVAGKSVAEFENRCFRKDGTLIDMVWSGRWSDEHKQLFSVARDVTRRKEAENALRDAEEKYRSIFEHSTDGIFQNTPDGRFLSANPALARILGFESPEELISARDDLERQGYVDPPLRSEFTETLERNGLVTGFEYEVYRKDGAKIWVSESTRIVRDDEGGTLYYEGSVQDITARKRAEIEASQSRRFLRSTVDALSSHIAILDESGVIIEVNGAWSRFAEENQAKSRLRGVGDNYLHLCDTAVGPFSEEAPAMAAGIRAVMAGERDTFELEYPCHGPREERWFIARVTRFSSEGLVRVVVAHENISVRKRAETEREVIAEIVQGVMTTNNLDELLTLAHRSIGKLLYAENCFVALHDTKSDLVHFGFWIDKFDPRPSPQPVGRGHFRTNSILRTGQPLVLTKELEARLCEQGAITKTGSAAASWMGVPLRTPTRTIGVLAVQHYEKEDAYSKRDLEFFSAVGDQIALAIERKRADEELKQSEERLAAAQKMAQVGSWEWDVITNEVIWSDQEYRLFGLEPGEQKMTHQFFLSLAHPSARRDAMRWFNAVRARKKSSRMDIPIVRADGQERILNSWADVVLDEAGNVVRVVGTSQDVTEREKAERALAQSEERFQLVSRATNDAIWDWDLVTNEISYSESFGTLFGYPAGGSSMEVERSRLHPDDHDELMAGLDAFFASREEAWSGEYRYLCKDGSYAFVYDRGYVVRDVEGKPLRMVGSMMNITERKQIEGALERQQSELRVLFDLMPAMIWFKDTKNGILRVNKRVADAAGMSVERIEGKPTLEIYPHEAARYYANDLEVINSGVPRLGLVETLTGPEGRQYSVQTDKVPYCDKEGNVIGIVVMAQDITERTRQETERQVISEIMQGVITTSNLDELLALAHRSIGKLLYAENCFVGLHNAKTDLIHFEFWVDKLDSVPPPQPISHGFTRSSYVLRTGQPLLLTKELETQLFEQGALAKSGSASASWLGVPLRTPTSTIGVLAVQHYEKENAYNQRDLEFLSAVGDQIALAIERKQAEDALRTSMEEFRTMAEAVPQIVWITDPDGSNIYFNQRWVDYTGLTLEESLGNGWNKPFHPDDQQAAWDAWQLATAITGIYSIECRLRRADGVYRWWLMRGVPQLDASGKILKWFGTCTDIHELRLAELEISRSNQELAESEERFQLVSRATNDAIWDWDVVANTISFSDSLGTLFGYHAGEFESTMAFWIARIHPDDHDAVMASVHAFFAGREELWLGEYRFQCADGSYAFVYDRGHVVRDVEGKAVRMVGAMMNITAQKKAEEDLRVAKEAAEAASRTKSEFLANMSHEIRTPMNGIIGMTDLALETDLNHEQREYLGMVKSSAHSLLGLINDILDFSKIEAGMLELEAIDFSLRDCIGGTLKPLALRADQKGLELVADISSDVPDHFVGDSMRLRQILINLTANAIKFTERGEVVLKVASQAMPDGESELHFSVADTGIGIPAEKQKTIFEAFAQADGSTTRTYGGTGLGLSIASQLIQKMHGKIWLESKVGEGTTFHFTVRLSVQQTPLPAAKSADFRDVAGLRALVVDDNAVNRRILHEMLLNWKMTPTVVASGRAGLAEMLRAAESGSAYQLVLLDGVMPEMDGFALAEKIQEKPELANATVMMLSSAMPGGSAARCNALGIASWLTKPVTQSDLLDAILVAIGGDSDDEIAPEQTTRVGASVSTERPLRILVAEDNPVNRAVATGILEKQGHVLVHAANGREAVEAFKDGAFDLILMDVQMPEMDGFEATRRIRELEDATGGHITIAAMTAHAMAGDRERCLAAGMDDYVSKPLRKEDLLRALDGARVKNASLETGARFLYSREELLSQCDGDEELMSELVSIFRDSTPEIVQAIGEAVETRQAPALATQSHKLLSSMGAFGADHARTLALRLEKHGQQNDFDGAKERFTELERETHKIYAALA